MSLTFMIVPNQTFDEVCLVEIRLRGGDLLLFGCCYRSPTPTESSESNNESLNRLLKCISLKKYSHICIVGDFNFKAINWSSWTTTRGDTSSETRFIETIRDCFLLQHVEQPTRRRGDDEPSTLDLVFSNESMQVSEITHNPPLGKSDHDVLTFDFHCYVDFAKPKDRYNFNKGDYAGMRGSNRLSTWRRQYLELSKKKHVTTEELWESLTSGLNGLVQTFVPLEKASNSPSWKDKGSIPIDNDTRMAIKEKEKSHRQRMSALKNGGEDSGKTKYTRARNRVTTLLRKAKRRFERDIARKAKSNPKAFWGHTRRNLKTKSGIAPLLSDPKNKDSMKFTDGEKATILSEQFSSVFTREKEGDIPRIESRTEKKIRQLFVTEKMVLEALKALNVNKSCGPDNLPAILLLELAEAIALPVSILFNVTLREGKLPSDWKSALITAIYKKGSRHLAENYRPISLTAILCKIMEKFVRDNVVAHLLEEKLLSKKQYGFITGRSTLTQLLYYLDECLKQTANGGVIDAIYLDFSKAFDTVPHQRLIGKLEAYGISGNILSWIKGFLQGRTQRVVVNGSLSPTAPVLSGIPQGTVLGPVLFVVYINDLLDNITSEGLMFADDTKIFRQITSREDAMELQSDLNKLEQWSEKWELKFNAGKCHVLTLGKFENIQYAHRYTVSDNELEHVPDEKDLGVTIDGELKFEEHIANKIRIANGIVGQIRRSFSYLDCETFRRIYIAFVRPHLEYCQSAWSPYLLRNIDALENVQIRATKLVDGLADLDYPERLKRINLPTLAFRRRRGDLIEMYKHFNSYDRSTLASSFNPRERPSRQHPFQVHMPQSNDGIRGPQSNFFYQRVAPVWNQLPEKIVTAEDVNAFKNELDGFWSDDPMKYNHRCSRAGGEEE